MVLIKEIYTMEKIKNNILNLASFSTKFTRVYVGACGIF